MNRDDRKDFDHMVGQYEAMSNQVQTQENWIRNHCVTSGKHRAAFVSLWVIQGIFAAVVGILCAYVF